MPVLPLFHCHVGMHDQTVVVQMRTSVISHQRSLEDVALGKDAVANNSGDAEENLHRMNFQIDSNDCVAHPYSHCMLLFFFLFWI